MVCPPSDVARFNDMFLEREEDAVIRLRSLEDLAAPPQSGLDLKDVYRCSKEHQVIPHDHALFLLPSPMTRPS